MPESHPTAHSGFLRLNSLASQASGTTPRHHLGRVPQGSSREMLFPCLSRLLEPPAFLGTWPPPPSLRPGAV